MTKEQLDLKLKKVTTILREANIHYALFLATEEDEGPGAIAIEMSSLDLAMNFKALCENDPIMADLLRGVLMMTTMDDLKQKIEYMRAKKRGVN